MPSDLQSLLDRVGRAEGSDRELDVSICEALHVKQLTYAVTPGEPWIIDPPLSSSLDAAVALVDRLGYLDIELYSAPPTACVGWTHGRQFTGKAKTPPLALLSALLIAKEGK